MQKITLNTILNFDDYDTQIVDNINKLKDQHKIGDFIAYCIKNYHRERNYAEQEQRIKQTQNAVIKLSRQISDIWDMAFKSYCLIAVGKRIGLENSAQNMMLSSFLLNKELNKIQEILDMPITELSNQEVAKMADEVVEYIIHSYDRILGEIVSLQSSLIGKMPLEQNTNIETLEEEEQTEEPTEEPPKEFGEGEDMDALLGFCGLG